MRAEERAAPLAGIRVIALEQFGAGPFATMQLADLGAEVVKIEEPSVGGDVGRYIPPGVSGSDSLYFETFNRGKRSVVLDVKTPAGREVFERLVATADIVFNNLRGDLPDTLGLTYDALGRVKAAIVCASLSAYGRRGDRRADPGYDALIQAEAGWAALTGGPDDPPTKSGLSVVDYAAGLAASFAMTAGVLDARRTGRGRDLDVNLYDVAIALLSYPATWLLSSGFVTKREEWSAHPSIVPFQFFETKDGHLAIACAKDRFFELLAPAMELGRLLDDARFSSMRARFEHRSELLGVLADRFRQRTTAEWCRSLRGTVPVAPVRSLSEALSVPELVERRMLAEYVHPRLGRVRSVGAPYAITDYAPDYRPGPALGADRDALLASAGYSAADVARLASEGAFGVAR